MRITRTRGQRIGNLPGSRDGPPPALADSFFVIFLVDAVAQIASAAGRIDPLPHSLRADFPHDASRAFFHFAIFASSADLRSGCASICLPTLTAS
jgi:hypothetical protein